MPNIAPDTQQNLFYTIYFTVSHNFEALVYLVFMGLAFCISLIKPTRATILIMAGFGLLLFGFQYNKHILEPLKMQTETALITERESFRIQRVIDITFARILPFAFPVGGWSMIGLGLIIGTMFEWRRTKSRQADPEENDAEIGKEI